MKENKEIKKEELEVKVSEAQETEQQEQQAEAPAQEQKQEVQEKPEKAKESIWSKAGRYAKAGAKKVGTAIKKAAPIVAIGTVVGGVLYFKGQADAYNSMLSGDGTEGEDNPELPDNGEQLAESAIEDAEFKEISSDEQSEE